MAGITIKWNEQRLREWDKQMKLKQQYVDNEVLKHCTKYIPLITGDLILSGIRGTDIGSGEVIYNSIYAKKRYYSKTPVGRVNGPLRGNRWFERMKSDKKTVILKGAQKWIDNVEVINESAVSHKHSGTKCKL